MINASFIDGAVILRVRVVPRASKSEIMSEHDGAVKVRIAAPPVDGAANEELVRLFAKEFDIAKADVQIIYGQSSKTKTIKISNLAKATFESRIK